MGTAKARIDRELERLRAVSGMSPEEAGGQIGESGDAVRAWEAGRGHPGPDELVSLCRLYGVRLDELFGPESPGSATGEGALSADGRRLLSLSGRTGRRGRESVLYILRRYSEEESASNL